MRCRLLLVGWSLCLVAGLSCAVAVLADDRVPMDDRSPGVYHGVAPGALPDTVYVLGGPNLPTGKFLTSEGWNGVDLSSGVARWHLDSFNCANLDQNPGNVAMYCGAMFDPCSCTATDPPQGYGNGWDEWLDWQRTVVNNVIPTSVRITAVLNYDTEPDHDFLYCEYETPAGWVALGEWTGSNGSGGVFTPFNFDQSFTVEAADYVGTGSNQIHLRWRATSDFAGSDQDCQHPTYGHTQIDNVCVYFNSVLQTCDDFQGYPSNWNVAFPPAVGDFAHVYSSLPERDLCGGNTTSGWAFVDNGTPSYGPGGHGVNLVGGAAGPGYHLHNEIWSPPLAWPAGYDGCLFNFDVYRHLPISNGLYYVWHVRSSTDDGATWSPWSDDDFVYYGAETDWLRENNNVTTHLRQGLNKIQVALGVLELGWQWGQDGTDATPAPYFDNVQVVAFKCGNGPAISARGVDLFQDNFPAIGAIDYVNLSNNSVRVDRARNLEDPALPVNQPGTDMVVDVVATRPGSNVGDPVLHVAMKANPVFDTYRLLPPNGTQVGDRITGWLVGQCVTPTRWRFELPDIGFFFPGDVIQYYISATDNYGTTTLPNDLTQYGKFQGDPGYVTGGYPSVFTVRALPTMFGATPGDQPAILFWNDNGDRGGEDEWFSGLSTLTPAYIEGVDYDVYDTNGPSSGVGNGLGGRATASQLTYYDVILYTSGDLGWCTLSSAGTPDRGNDLAVVNEWLALGAKGLFATGNDLAYDLVRSAAGSSFLSGRLGAVFNAREVRPLIGYQLSPQVKRLDWPLYQNFLADGGCSPMEHFNAVTATGGGVRIAEYSGGVYTYAAMVRNESVPFTKIVYSPVDFMFTNLPYPIIPKSAAPLQRRAEILRDILTYFGASPSGQPVGVQDTPGPAFSARHHPNPFNPQTMIEFVLPEPAAVELRIYDLSGRLVRTLLNQQMPAGVGSAVWDGTDTDGRAAASGVYFYKLQAGSYQKTEKLALIR